MLLLLAVNHVITSPLVGKNAWNVELQKFLRIRKENLESWHKSMQNFKTPFYTHYKN